MFPLTPWLIAAFSSSVNLLAIECFRCPSSSIVLCQRNCPFPSWTFSYSYSKELFLDWFYGDYLWTSLPLGRFFLSITGWIFVLLPRVAPLETMMNSLCYWSNRLPLSLFLPYSIGVLHNVCTSFWFTVLSDLIGFHHLSRVL